MKHRFFLRWAAISAAILLVFITALVSWAGSSSVDGVALIDGEVPVRGGTVVATALSSQGVARMPEPHLVGIAVTDQDGRFVLDMSRIEGDILDIELIPDQCQWTVASVQIQVEQLKEGETKLVRLEPRKDSVCDCVDAL